MERIGSYRGVDYRLYGDYVKITFPNVIGGAMNFRWGQNEQNYYSGLNQNVDTVAAKLIDDAITRHNTPKFTPAGMPTSWNVYVAPGENASQVKQNYYDQARARRAEIVASQQKTQKDPHAQTVHGTWSNSRRYKRKRKRKGLSGIGFKGITF